MIYKMVFVQAFIWCWTSGFILRSYLVVLSAFSDSPLIGRFLKLSSLQKFNLEP
jgi:hypothetical protein